MGKLTTAATGALSGGAAGSALGPIGSLVGGGIGALAGYFGGGNDDTTPKMPPIVDPVTGQQLQQAANNTQMSLQDMQAFNAAAAGQNGLGNQSSVFNQLQGVANGTGPNPAQAMLNQATGANVANQAALMASQRGAGANAGLIARQAAQQGANIQQQAAGQGATMQAQQALGALGQMGGISGQQVAQQMGGLNMAGQTALGNQGQVLGAAGQYNNAITGGQGNVNTANQDVAKRNAEQTGGLMQGFGTAATALAGMKKKSPAEPGLPETPNTVPQGTISNAFNNVGMAAAGGAVSSLPTTGPSSYVGKHLKGEKVPALVSPGEHYLPPKEVKKVAEGKKDVLKAGEKVPGKPKHPGNDYRNDTVSKTLKSGGLVIPNEVLQSKDPHKSAADFVRAVLAKQGLKQ